jgi:O-antigen ligase
MITRAFWRIGPEVGVRSPAVTALWGVALCGWTLLSRPDAPSVEVDSLAILLALLAFGAGVVVATVGGRYAPLVLPVGVLGAVLATAPASLSGSPLAPPLGYGNANGELLLVACAGLLLTARAADPRFRWPLVGAAVGTAGLCGLVHAQAAGACGLALVLWFLVRRSGPAWAWTAGSVALVLGAVGVTVLLGRGVAVVPESFAAALSAQRLQLWSEALDLANANPWTGVGAGRFPLLAPTASADPDLAWTHSAPLQAAAEQGYVGLVLFLGLLVWCLLMLRRDAPLAALVLLPCTIDYVLDFGWVVLAVGLLVGFAWRRATPAYRSADQAWQRHVKALR